MDRRDDRRGRRERREHRRARRQRLVDVDDVGTQRRERGARPAVGERRDGATVPRYGTRSGRPTDRTHGSAGGTADGASTVASCPASRSRTARPRTCTWTPPAASQAYGHTSAIRTAATSSQPGWNRCQSDGADAIACSKDAASARVSARRRPSACRSARSDRLSTSIHPSFVVNVGPEMRARPSTATGGRTGRHPAGPAEHLDLDAAAGQVAIRDERDDPVLLELLRELPADVIAREVDDVHPELRPMLEEQLEQRLRLQVLRDGHDRRHASPIARPPTSQFRCAEGDHDALPVGEPLLDLLDPLEPERGQDPLVVPAQHVERVEPVPRVGGERLAGRGPDERIVDGPPQDLRLVREDRRARPRRDMEERRPAASYAERPVRVGRAGPASS